MPPRRSSRTSQTQQIEDAESGSNDLFRGGEDALMDEGSDSLKVEGVEVDVGLAENEGGTKDNSSTNPTTTDVDMQDAAATQSDNKKLDISEQRVDIPTELEGEIQPQVASTSEEKIGADTSIEKNDISSTLSRDEPVKSSQSGELLASLPVYMSNSLPSSSTLQVFQYPTYPKGRPLPFPQSARERGLQAAMRTRPNAKRVEIELPLDLRPGVYNTDRGEEFGEGAAAAGPIGPGPKGANAPSSAIKGGEKRVKSEFGGYQSFSSPSADLANRKKLERTRLESLLMPHQTKYMLGVIRDKAVHLTPVDSVHQLRPSMHYIDALEALKRQQDKAAEEQNRAEEDDEEEARPNGASAQKARKTQSLNVSIRNDGSSSSGTRQGANGGPGGGGSGGGAGGDSRDYLMQAEREAESERWIPLDWKMDERSDEARKTFDSHLFAVDKTTRLQCKTKPREYLKM
jgi:DNA-directed RNA polymerase III subunit RPC5